MAKSIIDVNQALKILLLNARSAFFPTAIAFFYLLVTARARTNIQPREKII